MFRNTAVKGMEWITIKEIVSKIYNNNYEKANYQQWSIPESSITAFADTNNSPVGVKNSNARVKTFCMVQLVQKVKGK